MKKLHIDAGERFGLLVVIEEVEEKWFACGRMHRRFLCMCDCGTETTVSLGHLRNGHTTSCGCYGQGERHGKVGTRTYRIWRLMKTRCTNTHFPEYPRYGARGIAICEQWMRSFSAFLADMGECPEGHSIERVDNDGNYCPDNCVWATPAQQARNRRTTRWITFAGETLCIKDWAGRLGIDRHTIAKRLNKGWSPEEILNNGKA